MAKNNLKNSVKKSITIFTKIFLIYWSVVVNNSMVLIFIMHP